MIGDGGESNGLYILEPIGRESKVFHASTEWEKAMLLHQRLGHALLSIGNCSSLDISNDVKELNCETCQYAKKCRNSYSVSINKSSISFDLIHSDVWCVSLVFV